MKKLNLTTLILTLLALFASSVVSAHGGYNSFNFGINLGHYPGYYGYSAFGYQDPFFYPPVDIDPRTVVVPLTAPPVVIPSAPPVYTQQETRSSMQQQTNYWHYCSDSDGYYPYVKECPGGWLQVAPNPAQ